MNALWRFSLSTYRKVENIITSVTFEDTEGMIASLLSLFEPRWPVFIYTGCDPLVCPSVACIKLFQQAGKNTAGQTHRGMQSGKGETLHHYTHLFHSHGDLSHE